MKAVVIYQSKTGFVKKYAQWISEELSANIFDLSKANVGMLEPYDTVIYGGSLHAVGINGVKFITKNFDKIRSKKIIVFACGASVSSDKVIKKVAGNNFTFDQQKYIKFFYLRGGFDYDKLPPFDKLLMTLLKWKIKNKKRRKKELTSDEMGMLTAYDKPVDFTRKRNIETLIDFAKR